MPDMTNEMETKIYEALVDRYGASAQIIVAIEEMAELQKALTKWLRYLHELSEGNLNDIRAGIREEIADVSIMLNQLELMFGDTGEIQEQKLQRLFERVDDMFDENVERKPMHWWGGGEDE